METFKIKYKGELIEAVRDNNGGYSVDLPKRKGDRGAVYSESIYRVENGWKFSSTESDDPTYYFDVYLFDDGKTGWANDMPDRRPGPLTQDERLHKSSYKFDPKYYDKTDPVEKVCAEIYGVVEQFYNYEKNWISPEKVINLRKAYLSSMLKMLGYSSTDRVKKEMDQPKSYMALGKVASMLERYKNLGALYSQVKPGVYDVNIPEGMTQEELKSLIISVGEDIKSINERMDAEDELNQVKRSVLPTFGLTMQDEVTEEEWNKYTTNVSRTAELLLELNYDIVPEMDKITLKDESKLDGLDLGDRISRLIDTKEFSEACNIEDNYVKAENDRLATEIDILIDGSERVIKSTPGAALEFLKRQAMISRDERDDYIKKYEEIEKMYYSKLGKIKPEEPVHEEKNEEEEGRDPYDD